MTRRLALLGTTAGLALATAQALGAGDLFRDPSGDTVGAPDITNVRVGNDDAGLIVFGIEAPNQPTLAADSVIGVAIDSDQNAGTGAPDGTTA